MDRTRPAPFRGRHLLSNLTLSDIATCRDELREFQRNSKTPMSPACQQVFGQSAAKGTDTWHYVNIPISIAMPSEMDIASVCRKTPCVVDNINIYGAILADTSKPMPARLQALSFVVHFIGDVHQPLHTAIRDNDAGGNAEQVRIDNQTMSLHHAWDEPLVSARWGRAHGCYSTGAIAGPRGRNLHNPAA